MQKKKIGHILFTAAVMGICVLPTVVMPWQKAESVGNEQLAELPELLDEDGKFNSKVLNEFSDYFADHFGFRHEMITLNDQLTGKLFQDLDSSSVLLGRDGWLFYKSTLEDYTGTDLFTPRQSYAAAHVLQLMQEYSEENGIRFYFTVAPNKNSLYGSQMPSRYAAAQTRSIERLKQQMAQQNVHYIDLYETLSGTGEQLYYRLDSHWNMQGAQLAAQTLLKELKGTAPDFDAHKTGQTTPHTGDLYEMVYPSGKETEADAAYDFDYTYDEKFRSADDITIHTENSGEGESIFVYRDSFGINLHPFLAQSYGKACFSRSMPYRLSAVTAEQPDGLLVEIVERNLNWLLERAPELPAPERQNIKAADSGKTVAASEKDGNLEGYFCLSGDLGQQAVDDESPVYLLTGDAVYEASPCGDGAQPFTAYLPEEARGQEFCVAFMSGGEMISCALTD